MTGHIEKLTLLEALFLAANLVIDHAQGLD